MLIFLFLKVQIIIFKVVKFKIYKIKIAIVNQVLIRKMNSKMVVILLISFYLIALGGLVYGEKRQPICPPGCCPGTPGEPCSLGVEQMNYIRQACPPGCCKC